jgi:hypothetical protein
MSFILYFYILIKIIALKVYKLIQLEMCISINYHTINGAVFFK